MAGETHREALGKLCGRTVGVDVAPPAEITRDVEHLFSAHLHDGPRVGRDEHTTGRRFTNKVIDVLASGAVPDRVDPHEEAIEAGKLSANLVDAGVVERQRHDLDGEFAERVKERTKAA